MLESNVKPAFEHPTYPLPHSSRIFHEEIERQELCSAPIEVRPHSAEVKENANDSRTSTISLLSTASWVSRVVSCLAGGDGLDDDCTDVLPPLWDLLDDLVGGGGGSPLSPRPLFRLKPLKLLGNGGSPCKEDIAILSCMLRNELQIKNFVY